MSLLRSLRWSCCCFFFLFIISTVIPPAVDANSYRDDRPHRQKRYNENVQLQEDERIEEYHKRNYTWPLNNYNPNTTGWKQLMEERFAQVAQIPELGDRYEGYIQTMHSAFLVPNFTEHGFGLARCPDDLLQALQQGIHDGLHQATGGNKDNDPNLRKEHRIPVIEGPDAPWMITRPDLTKRVLQELQHYAETWANGMPLSPYMAYGFRLYRNQSQL